MGIIINPTDYDDWRWGGRARPIGANQPTFANFNGTGIYAWHFSNNDELHFPELQLTHAYKEGTDLVPHIHWCPTTTATYTGQWSLEWVDWVDIHTGTPVQSKTTVTVTFNSAMTAYQMQTSDFSAVISGTNRKISSILHARLVLTQTAGADCVLCGLDAHFQKDRLGSATITTK